MVGRPLILKLGFLTGMTAAFLGSKAACSEKGTTAPIVTVSGGQIRGQLLPTPGGAVFKGIPFAQPPVWQPRGLPGREGEQFPRACCGLRAVRTIACLRSTVSSVRGFPTRECITPQSRHRSSHMDGLSQEFGNVRAAPVPGQGPMSGQLSARVWRRIPKSRLA
jgi:hypothetical protein